MLQSQIQPPPCDGEASAESSGFHAAARFLGKLLVCLMNVNGGSQAERTLLRNQVTQLGHLLAAALIG